MAESRGVQTIIRTVKDRSNPYVIVNNTVFTDPRISWKAKGLMGYFLSRPDDWQVAVGDLVRCSRDGREAVYSGLRELIEQGYVVRTPARPGQGGYIIPLRPRHLDGWLAHRRAGAATDGGGLHACPAAGDGEAEPAAGGGPGGRKGGGAVRGRATPAGRRASGTKVSRTFESGHPQARRTIPFPNSRGI